MADILKVNQEELLQVAVLLGYKVDREGRSGAVAAAHVQFETGVRH